MSEDQGTTRRAVISDVVDPVVAEVEDLMAALASPLPRAEAPMRIERIRRLEELKATIAAAQARETVAFKQSVVTERRALGLTGRRLVRGIGSEVALARRESPHRQFRLMGLADALVAEMPHTEAALTAGVISEWRASLLVQETACLTLEHRQAVDAELAGRMESMSDKELRAEAKRIGYRLDPYSIINRASRAEADRRVTSRPAPDTMMNVTALLPVVQGAAVMAALTKAANAAQSRPGGDERSRAQLMADTFVERVTGQTKADETPVEVCLQMTDRVMFGDSLEPGWLAHYGPLPAPWLRNLLRRIDDRSTVWVRRFFTDGCSGLLSAVDTKRRLVTGILRRAVIYRDQWCRTPWCGAPIRHLDHVTGVAEGGATTIANVQGLCEACNYAKEGVGWRARPGLGGAGDSVEITTPSGQTYTSRPPPLPGTPPTGPTEWAPTVTAKRGRVIDMRFRTPVIEYAA
jgi:hypothetical protein